MNERGTSSTGLLTTLVVIFAIADALAIGLGGCQKDPTATAKPPAEQSLKTPALPEKNPGDTTSNAQKPDQSGTTEQRNQ